MDESSLKVSTIYVDDSAMRCSKMRICIEAVLTLLSACRQSHLLLSVTTLLIYLAISAFVHQCRRVLMIRGAQTNAE